MNNMAHPAGLAYHLRRAAVYLLLLALFLGGCAGSAIVANMGGLAVVVGR